MAEKVYFDSRTEPHIGHYAVPSGEWVCDDDCPHSKHHADAGERAWRESAIDALDAPSPQRVAVEGTWRIFMPHSMEPATVASFLTEDQAREQIEAWKKRKAKGSRPDLAHVDLDALEVRRVR